MFCSARTVDTSEGIGGRDVPFGVFKSGPNRYVPFDGSLTEEDLRTVLRKGDSPYYSPRK